MSSKKVKEIEKEKVKHTKRNIIILVAFLVIVLVAVVSIVLLKPVKEKESTSEEPQVNINELSLEIGDEIPLSKDFSGDLIDYEVIIDDEILSKIYLKDDTELNEEEYDKLSDEEKDGYTVKKILLKLGTFDVTLKKDDKEYQAKLTIQDTLAPTLVLKEVTITDGDELTIDSFIESCTDNSRGDCTYTYVDDENNEIESIDTSVGEHTVSILAKDESENKTTESTKLIVNKKPEEKPANNTSSNKTNTTTNSNSNKANTSSNNSSNNNNSNSTGNTSGNETTACEIKSNYSSIPVYMKANCVEVNSAEDKANQTNMKSLSLANQILDGQAYAELKKCDSYFQNLNGVSHGSFCADYLDTPILLFSTDYRIYGYAIRFKMYYSENDSTTYNKLASEGYVKSDNTIVYTTKNIPY